ncbi:MAG: nucleotidyltransferase substrate binding protein [Candidatus Melainabacteria bacterium]|nr:nucleotidyltransferase substrate binding protein [Candidatus Melainabacteria bacterium]
MTTDNKPRWQYRFDNYKRAYTLLREAMAVRAERELSQLEKEGIIQRFEYTVELAWKTMKDYLESQNVLIEQITPRAVIKEAVAAKLVEDGQTWMNALDARNKIFHTYDFKQFEAVIQAIETGYLAVIEALYFKLMEYLLLETTCA